MNERPSRLALKRLQRIKQRYLPRCSNVAEVVEKLFAYWKEEHQKQEPTRDTNLLESTACPCRFKNEGSYFCGYKIPNCRPRKLLSIKECQICLVKNKKKIQRITMEKIGLTVAGVKGSSQDEKLQKLKLHAEQLAEGHYQQHCSLTHQAHKLFDLPCVKETNNFERPFNCKNVDCEERIRNYVKALYLGTI
jgi:hypothetical protein